MPYFHLIAFVLIVAVLPDSPQFQSSIARAAGLDWLVVVLIIYESLVASVAWNAILGLVLPMISVVYAVLGWILEAQMYSSSIII